MVDFILQKYIAVKYNYLDGLEYYDGTIVDVTDKTNDRIIVCTPKSTHIVNPSYFLNYYKPLSDYRKSQIEKIFTI